MLDDLLDVFGRKDRKKSAKPSGFSGMLSSMLGDDDRRGHGQYAAPRHGFGDSDDDDDRDRSYPRQSRRGFSFED